MIFRFLILPTIALTFLSSSPHLSADAPTEATLKNEKLTATFTAKSGLRLAKFHLSSVDINLFKESETTVRGLKTWIMNPFEIIEHRDELSTLDGRIKQVSSNQLKLTSAVSDKLKLQSEWIATLKDDQLDIEMRVYNWSNVSIDLSVWSVGAISPNAKIRIPFDSPTPSEKMKPQFPQELYLYKWSYLQDPRLTSNVEALSFSVGYPETETFFKLGLLSKAGVLELCKGTQKLTIASPHETGATYPEGGANISFFQTPTTAETVFAEIEHMSPIKTIAPNEYHSLFLTLRVEAITD